MKPNSYFSIHFIAHCYRKKRIFWISIHYCTVHASILTSRMERFELEYTSMECEKMRVLSYFLGFSTRFWLLTQTDVEKYSQLTIYHHKIRGSLGFSCICFFNKLISSCRGSREIICSFFVREFITKEHLDGFGFIGLLMKIQHYMAVTNSEVYTLSSECFVWIYVCFGETTNIRGDS